MATTRASRLGKRVFVVTRGQRFKRSRRRRGNPRVDGLCSLMGQGELFYAARRKAGPPPTVALSGRTNAASGGPTRDRNAPRWPSVRIPSAPPPLTNLPSNDPAVARSPFQTFGYAADHCASPARARKTSLPTRRGDPYPCSRFRGGIPNVRLKLRLKWPRSLKP